MLTEEMLEKYKKLYLEKYKVQLSDEQATKDATAFLNLMKVLLKKDPEENKQPTP